MCNSSLLAQLANATCMSFTLQQCPRAVTALCHVMIVLPAQLANASYVWLPLVPNAHGYEIRDLKSWRLRDFCGGSA